jgi:DNA-binding GntR family transcriptional regulator
MISDIPYSHSVVKDDPKPILSFKSLKEQVYEYLREQLHTGALKPGVSIDMEETSRRLGVSKTPLRDAILQLEMEDFVTIQPRRKVVVNTLGLRDVRNYYEIIGALEATALCVAFPKLGEGGLRRMEKANEAMKRAIEADNFDLYYEKNLEFHDTYLDLCGNENLARIVDLMKKRLYDFPRPQGFVKEWEEASIGEHRRLLELIRSGNAEEAADWIRDAHWSFAVQERFISRYYVDIS